MSCDFYRDVNNRIWLYYASDVLARQRIRNDAERLEEEALTRQAQDKAEKLREKQRLMVEERKQMLVRDESERSA
jgi:hypothetical protein